MQRRNFIGLIVGGVVLLPGMLRAGPPRSNGGSAEAGPKITRLVIVKHRRRLYLLSGRKVVRRYSIDLGFAPKGDKKFEGDGRTPEGHYVIDRKNPNSRYHLSLGISYPNARDRAEAARLGKSPGGDIFIHGRPFLVRLLKGRRDWTAGCIAVSNREIEEIYRLVDIGTPIDIYP